MRAERLALDFLHGGDDPRRIFQEGEMKRHKSITLDRIMIAVRADDHLGFCIACGEEAYGVEPDAREYECESCGEKKVYGAQELLISTPI